MTPMDPLKIGYYLVLPNHSLEDASPFQGFSQGWHPLSRFVQELATLPTDVTEGDAPLDPLISQRMGGMRMLSWSPIMIDSLEPFTARELGLFVVVFSADEDVARRTEAWRDKQAIKPLHVSSADVEGPLSADDFTIERLIEHCRTILAEHGDQLNDARRALAKQHLDAWAPRHTEPSGLALESHNLLAPNQLSLMRANRGFEPGDVFTSPTEAGYDEKILEIVKAVFTVRERAGVRPFHRMSLLHPELFLVEPALYRQAYRRIDDRRAPDRVAAAVLKMLQTQSGFLSLGPTPADLEGSEAAQALMAARRQELTIFTLAVGLAASLTTSAVMRLRPAVNRIYPLLSSYARSVRSEKSEFRRKARRLFGDIQDALKEAVGSARLEFLEQDINGPVKIIADAPIEWLPIRGLPLMLRYQCSRINEVAPVLRTVWRLG